jgi:hypothetical protein
MGGVFSPEATGPMGDRESTRLPHVRLRGSREVPRGYTLGGVDRRFVIEYVNWGMSGPPPQFFYLDLELNHQVVLYEDGDIEFRCGPRNAPGVSTGCGSQQSGCSATIGIEGTAPGQDTDLACCNSDDSAYDGLAIRFVHPSAQNAVPPAPVLQDSSWSKP